MSGRDILALVLSYVYAFGLLFAVEAVGRRLRWAQEFTRKIIHIGAGLWVWGVLALFEHWTYGIIPFATFIVLNYVFYRQQSFKAMDARESTMGTVYFAFSITVLFLLFWRTGGQVDRAPIAAAAAMAMTLGDAMANIVGIRWGKHVYTVLGHPRTWEGTAAMAVVSFLSILSVLALVPGSWLSPNSVPWSAASLLLLSVVGTFVATVAEGLSPAGTDNLSVPLLTGLALYLVGAMLGGDLEIKVAFGLGLGLVVSGLIGVAAYRRQWLTQSGVIGAVIVGTIIFGFGGWVWGMLLIAFFVLASLLSHFRAADKKDVAEKFAKGGQRDLGQALANGGAGALIALAWAFWPEPVMLAAFVGAIATVNADTWATEVGVLSRRPPRLVTTWRQVEPGTSGGISLLGTLATAGGALAIGLIALIFVTLDDLFGGPGFALVGGGSVAGVLGLLPAATVGGLAGSLIDSVLGATVQAIYYSHRRGQETEKRVDPDGTANEHIRGWNWLNNDWVNLISSLVGALASAWMWVILEG
jgi:uncharacterized protein (TIGR00297 family)